MSNQEESLRERPCFRRYWTPQVLSIVWILAVVTSVVVIGIHTLMAIDAASQDTVESGLALTYHLLMVFAAAIGLICLRLTLETVSVLFDIRYELKLANSTRGS